MLHPPSEVWDIHERSVHDPSPDSAMARGWLQEQVLTNELPTPRQNRIQRL
jgi:hypothetical protein